MSSGKIQLCLLGALICSFIGTGGVPKVVLAQADGKQATQTEVNEGIEKARKTIDDLTKKVYAAYLFSPRDTDRLVQLKIDLLDIWEKNPTNKSLAKPLYETAVLLMQREMFDDSKEIIEIIIENFPKYSANADEEEEEEETDSEEGATTTSTVDYSAKAQKLLKKVEQYEAELQ